jgi:hypothetical protein
MPGNRPTGSSVPQPTKTNPSSRPPKGEKLQRLVHAGIDFPLVYVAHEILKGRLAMPEGTIGAMNLTSLTIAGFG